MAKRDKLADRVRNAVDALLGVSAYQRPPVNTDIPEEVIERIREEMGGNIQPLPVTKLRWYLEDLEFCQTQADMGTMRLPAQLCRAMNRDGTIKGLLKTRTKGLIRLPKRFYGDESESGPAAALKARNGSRSVFDEMLPPSEL